MDSNISMIHCMYCELGFIPETPQRIVEEHIQNCESEYILQMQSEMNLGTDPYGIDDNSSDFNNDYEN